MIARAADGSMRDALSLTDQVLSMGDGRAHRRTRARRARPRAPRTSIIARARPHRRAARRRRVPAVCAARRRRASTSASSSPASPTCCARSSRSRSAATPPEVTERARDALEARRDGSPRGDLLRMLTAIAELEPRFRKSGQQQLLLETLLVRFALLDRTVALEDVLRGLGGWRGVRAAGSRGGGRRAAPASSRGRRARPSGVRAPSVAALGRHAPADAPSRSSGAADRARSRPAAARRRRRGRRHRRAAAVARRSAATAAATASTAHVRAASRRAGAADHQRDRGTLGRRRRIACATTGMLLPPRSLEHASPSAVTATGDRHDRARRGEAVVRDGARRWRRPTCSRAVRTWFAGVERVAIRAPKGRRRRGPHARVTDEDGARASASRRSGSAIRCSARRSTRSTSSSLD